MTTSGWTWAELSSDQLRRLTEAEHTLGAEYLLVYRPVQRTSSRAVESQVRKLRAAPLTESQLECLRGLESQLQAVVVAYADQPQP